MERRTVMRWSGLFIVLFILCATTACDPLGRAPDADIRGGALHALKSDTGPSQRDDVADARKMVDDSLVLENGEELTVDEWLRGKMENSGGQIMFPRWDVRRKGANKFEVSFAYTVLKEDYSIEKEGYAWRVDTVLRLVSAPTALDEKDMERQSGIRPPAGRPSEKNPGLFRLE
ncbi:MAG: hypothetical protein PHP44_13425 [Kiritimatiellae bacterium]|nr:hypothetical protein [Kiritimatiellia bacterium]MDD4737092.1 hypothetical protein [Kiritimatiellia bacterium]